jgi:hypothetical protein
MTAKKKWIALFLLIVFLHSFALLKIDFAQQVVQEDKTGTDQEEVSERIVPGPQGIKESTSMYVFIAWMWLAILVLVYFLRLKIKEVDRLLEIRFLSDKKK